VNLSFSHKISFRSYVLCGSDMVKLKRYNDVANVKYCWSSWKPRVHTGITIEVKSSSYFCMNVIY
jgi:hypothetical protein